MARSLVSPAIEGRAGASRYGRAVDYLAAAQIYLKSNPLLEEPLRAEHIKERLLGHWGTAPGINLIYAALNREILRSGASVLLVTGPGHGAAANMANMYLEGTITEYYPELTRDRAGLEMFLRFFSWPRRLSEPPLPRAARRDPRGRRARVRALDGVRRRAGRPRAGRRLHRRRRRGGDRADGRKLERQQVPQPRDGRSRPADPPPQRLEDREPVDLRNDDDEEIRSVYSGYGWEVVFVRSSDDIERRLDEAMTGAFDAIRALQGRCRGR